MRFLLISGDLYDRIPLMSGLKKYIVPTGLYGDLNLLSTNILSLWDSRVRG